MAKYIGKRLVTGILSLFVLATVTFFLTRVIPGSPFQGANVSESVLQMMEEEYGLHQPAGVQYVTYMKHLLRGNLGYSYQNPSESVANIIQRSWPVTAVIGVLAILLAMIVGIGIGVWQTFFETQAASWRAFYRNTSDRRSSQFCGSTFADACIWSLAEMAAGQRTGFLEKLHSPGMRSGAVSRLFAGTADRDTSCPGETKRLCTSGADERIEKKTDLVYAHSAAYLDSGAELSGTCKCVSFDRKFCGGEYFYHSGAWQAVCKFHCKPGLYSHFGVDDLYGDSCDPDPAGSGLT